VPFENVIPRALEGSEYATLLFCGGGVKGVFIGVFFLPDSPFVIAAHRRTWRYLSRVASLIWAQVVSGRQGERRRCHGYGCVPMTKSQAASFYSGMASAGNDHAGGENEVGKRWPRREIAMQAGRTRPFRVPAG
jgi:hypothetical protein